MVLLAGKGDIQAFVEIWPQDLNAWHCNKSVWQRRGGRWDVFCSPSMCALLTAALSLLSPPPLPSPSPTPPYPSMWGRESSLRTDSLWYPKPEARAAKIVGTDTACEGQVADSCFPTIHGEKWKALAEDAQYPFSHLAPVAAWVTSVWGKRGGVCVLVRGLNLITAIEGYL